MIRYKPKSFAWKLLFLAIMPMSAAITLLCAVMVLDRYLSVEQVALRNLTTSAEMIAIHMTAPMLFNDPAAGHETLAALTKSPTVSSTRIYDRNGNVFASYTKESAPGPLPDKPLPIGHEMLDQWFTLTIPIQHDGEVLGSLTMSDDMTELRSQLYRDILIVVSVGVIVFGCVVVLTLLLSRALLRPVTLLATAARRVTQSQDYTIRAEKCSNDELGELTDTFNGMLTQIQSRDIALELHAAELSRANAELEQFAYVASHDLQEPLRMVASYLQLLEMRYTEKLDGDAKEFIKYAVDGASRMKRLINDLLSLSRVGTRGKAFEPTDLNVLIDEVLVNLKVSIEETGAVVTKDTLPSIPVDSSQVSQLFQNLIANAIKFRGKEQPRIHVSVEPDGDNWKFSVSDNGIGIDSKYYDRIFVIFQRLCTSAEYPGTGIGLSVCKKIVERHGGKIWVESTPGKGTTFYFTMRKERVSNDSGTRVKQADRDLVGGRQSR